MKKTFLTAMFAVAMLLPVSQVLARNATTTVDQVKTTVEISDDVDYVVTSATPFDANGVINILNTDHAVLILNGVKPSQAIQLLAAHVKINGQMARNNVNCQVKMHNLGTIIMPYASTMKPLTVYSGQNFEGEAVNAFGLENSGGYMNTLTEAKLNNRIRSFKLKRGYMVTFSTQASGRGYSRCFIAADEDLEVSVMPAILDRTITSYRVFKWYDAGKRQLANDLNTTHMDTLNVQSSYTWSQGHDLSPNYECVPNHIYEDYPSSAAIGSATWSPHSKNNNEPLNSSDDHPQDLATILNNWQNMMRTGMRLCTPASWDGSDYWNATGFLAQFLDSIDARGWRCDIIDLHCYWAEGSFGNIANWVNKYHRPVWISEWCWGASWNSNGAFANGVTENQVRDALERICARLNGYDYVERYFYWNGERDPSRLLKYVKNSEDKDSLVLTPAGVMYRNLDSGLAYNAKYDFVPKTPPMYDPTGLIVSFDKTTMAATLTWHDYNGEYNQTMVVERQMPGSRNWVLVAEVERQETEADYTYEHAEAVGGSNYRIRVVDANGKERMTRTVMAASDDLKAGDAVQVNGAMKYLGGNLLYNGDFELGTAGWTNGLDEPIGQPYFQVVPLGGVDATAYLQAYGDGSLNTAEAVKTVIDLKPSTDYYFTGASRYNNSILAQFNLSTDGVISSTSAGALKNPDANWTNQFSTFNTGDYEKGIVGLRSLKGTAAFDNLMLCQLFDTREEAIADAVGQARNRAEWIAQQTVQYNGYLNEVLSALNTVDDEALDSLNAAISLTLQAWRTLPQLVSLTAWAERLAGSYQLYDSDGVLAGLINEIDEKVNASATFTPAWVVDAYDRLEMAIDQYCPMVYKTGLVKSPSFDGSSTGWTTKCGTYTGGDQRTNTNEGISFWNAWWSGLSASEGTGKSMAIRQELSGLDHGLYAVECKAATEHYCLSDQHAFITNGELTQASQTLTADYYDLPTVNVANRWQTLTTPPVYVDDEGTVTIGFEGSKQGAVDNAWHRYGEPSSTGDKREGWWSATDFVVRFSPLYRTTVVPDQWGVICLPYAVHPSKHLSFYEIAGITSDFQNLCLRQVDEGKAGQAFIYRSTQADVDFLEYGDAVSSTTDAPGNLRGYLKTGARVAKGYYYLTDGQWVKVTGDDRPYMSNYTAIMRPLTDRHSNRLDIFDTWDGPTMPIVGMTQAEIEASVDSPVLNYSAARYFTPDGRLAAPAKSGLYIKVENGRASKIMIQ